MTQETAFRLFDEARLWSSGRVQYVTPESELRQIAQMLYGQAMLMQLQRVCDDIFYTIACDRMKVEP